MEVIRDGVVLTTRHSTAHEPSCGLCAPSLGKEICMSLQKVAAAAVLAVVHHQLGFRAFVLF